MRTVSLGISASPSPTVNSINNLTKISPNLKKLSLSPKLSRGGDEPSRSFSSSSSSLCNSPKPGICKASQTVELFPSVCPEIVVREARLEDFWEVVETHCSSFFPNYSFPLDLMLRINRLVGMVSGFSVPNGCRRTYLVALVGSSSDDNFYIGNEDFKVSGFEGKFSFNRGYVAGILTVDTVADFLPRKGPLRQRRTGIAYISNVAVRERDRRKGIAKRLVAKAEAQARSWGCRAVALHCETNNPGATLLYKSRGFKCIKVPEQANWPRPKTAPNVQFSFMMKLITKPNTT